MVAHIQLANVTFFARLGWAVVGEAEIYVGLPHQPMASRCPASSTVPRSRGSSPTASRSRCSGRLSAPAP